MMCLFADLSLYRGKRRQPLHRTCNSKRISLRGTSPRRISARLLDVCDLTAIATATPWPQSCRGVANLSLRASAIFKIRCAQPVKRSNPVSYTHLRAHETDSYLVCRLLLEKK